MRHQRPSPKRHWPFLPDHSLHIVNVDARGCKAEGSSSVKKAPLVGAFRAATTGPRPRFVSFFEEAGSDDNGDNDIGTFPQGAVHSEYDL